jgi:hypothetical protein
VYLLRGLPPRKLRLKQARKKQYPSQRKPQMGEMLPELAEILSLTLVHLKKWFVNQDNSPVWLTLFGAIVSSFAGAYGAQKIAENNKNREVLLSEIRNTNVCITLAFDICNAALSLKKQHVRSMAQEYEKNREKFLLFLNSPKLETPPNTILEVNFCIDFRFLLPLHVPIESLRDQLFGKVSLTGRPILLVSAILRIVEALNTIIEKRNIMIDSFKKKSEVNHDNRAIAASYFGIEQEKGVDLIYLDYMRAIPSQLDDVIKFSSFLCEDLNKHGEKLKIRLGDKKIKIAKPDFEISKKDNLMPDDSLYADWISMVETKNKLSFRNKIKRFFGMKEI